MTPERPDLARPVRTRTSRAPGRRPAIAFTAAVAASVLALSAAPRPVGPQLSFAHTGVESKRPADGATAKTNTTSVAVLFGGSVRSARITVTGPGSKKVSGATRRDKTNKKRFSTPLAKGLKAGNYRAKLTYSAGDGHSQTITWPFKLKD